jgi:SAM-dependent methyltransferase
LEKIAVADGKKILDAGTSTGTNLRLLQEMSIEKAVGLDISEEALSLCQSKNFEQELIRGDLKNLPFKESEFDVVLMTDILEHIDDDQRAIEESYRVLRKGGYAIVAVPTFPMLWGLQDKVSHHLRRYRKNKLRKKLLEAGYQVVECYYYNFVLFFPIFFARQILKIFKPQIQSENEVNTYFLNKFMTFIFKLDIRVSRYVRPPIGVSAFFLLKKN